MSPETREQMDRRIDYRERIFIKAGTLVAPIVEQHGIEDHQDGGAIFVRGVNVTAVEQHLEHIMRVADWLLVREE
jgi:hypothetical protein